MHVESHDAERDDDAVPVRGSRRKGEETADKGGMVVVVVMERGDETREKAMADEMVGMGMVFVVVMLRRGPWIKKCISFANGPIPNRLPSPSSRRFCSLLLRLSILQRV